MVADDESHDPPQIKLRGFERLTTLIDRVSMKIVHSTLVAGDAETLLRLLPEALMQTFNMHPRMRALQLQSQDFTAEIQEHLTLDDISGKNILRVEQFNWGKF
ncbi:hypothetical protein PHYPSEUDO_010858 [Phytophthora pseudosyringae]|uniref:Uncharacterized protein n=1 Tax=Phytophthora pseudosyringae TaxID=221518 RepID=A0A8T1VCP2_9STRA|nr:hypothetical protein PHYPSEUDO_010858 [Phytophthora pseudosyringae]